MVYNKLFDNIIQLTIPKTVLNRYAIKISCQIINRNKTVTINVILHVSISAMVE